MIGENAEQSRTRVYMTRHSRANKSEASALNERYERETFVSEREHEASTSCAFHVNNLLLRSWRCFDLENLFFLFIFFLILHVLFACL